MSPPAACAPTRRVGGILQHSGSHRNVLLDRSPARSLWSI